MLKYLLVAFAAVSAWNLVARLLCAVSSARCCGVRLPLEGCLQCQAVADTAFTRAAHFCPDCNTDAHRFPRLRLAVWRVIRPW